MTISGGTAYDGEYLDFEVASATTDERLSLLSVDTPSITSGEVSVVDGAVYLGDGTQALPIGSVDDIYDGREGRRLRVNLISEFANPGFEDGNLTGGPATSPSGTIATVGAHKFFSHRRRARCGAAVT